jgi:hypothetical protein
VSDSYPIIQESLSEMQREFMGCVEMHLDPPEDPAPAYRVEAVYRYADGEARLPGNAIRFMIAAHETDEDTTERRHTIDFLLLGETTKQAPVARISHSMKRVEASQGRLHWTECHFQVASPDFPHSQAPREVVEREVQSYLERVKR